jgi:predicted RNA-binding Zn-ribbon protein involved in translation (DUF1610 family)
MEQHSDRPPSRASNRKGALFCPACGHEAHIDGDWSVSPTPDGDVYRCPACDETVTVRPNRGDHTPGAALLACSAPAALVWVPDTTADRDTDADGCPRDPSV